MSKSNVIQGRFSSRGGDEAEVERMRRTVGECLERIAAQRGYSRSLAEADTELAMSAIRSMAFVDVPIQISIAVGSEEEKAVAQAVAELAVKQATEAVAMHCVTKLVDALPDLCFPVQA